MWQRRCSQPWMRNRYRTGLFLDEKEKYLSRGKWWKTLALTEAGYHVLHRSACTVCGGDWWTWTRAPGTSLKKRTYSSVMELLVGPAGRSSGSPALLSPPSLSVSLLRTLPSSPHPLQKTPLLYPECWQEHALTHSKSFTIHYKVTKNGCWPPGLVCSCPPPLHTAHLH